MWERTLARYPWLSRFDSKDGWPQCISRSLSHSVPTGTLNNLGSRLTALEEHELQGQVCQEPGAAHPDRSGRSMQ